jgi:hypothetical protein
VIKTTAIYEFIPFFMPFKFSYLALETGARKKVYFGVRSLKSVSQNLLGLVLTVVHQQMQRFDK